ncbi:MAG TPA: methylmalonyl Co-A mutase-associated GTPase MeaB [Nitrospiria bacterium]|nr:methylmalonyl Co-A mutase-associated GTPase MeaB [Nitrospiria bacterium]
MNNWTRKIRSGDFRAAAKLITAIERGDPSAVPILKSLYPYTGRARIIGITGSTGTGKSSLINGLTTGYRRLRQRVGILAVDPTSPISGGAILGDRIRMREHFTDPGVFIRSIASRGAPGGLPVLVLAEAVHVLDALGMDVVFIETIGVGQDQTAVSSIARTTVVVLNPTMGDEVQLLKAGIMEVADLFVVNKADLPGGDTMAIHLSDLSGSERPIPVFKTSALKQLGIDELIKGLNDLARKTRQARQPKGTDRR